MREEQERELWVALAELFFLDTEPQGYNFDYVLRLLVAANWTPGRTQATLVQLIAPIAGHNLGFLIWPVIGAWSGFDKADLCQRVERLADRRARYPKWYFRLSDWYCERMLRKLDMERLLKCLAARHHH